jgi:hypothetical protein
MSRLFREERYEALQDVIVSTERAAEIERQYEGVHLPAYCQKATDEEGLVRTFVGFAGQGVRVGERFGILKQEIDRDFVLVKFKDGTEKVDRHDLRRLDPDPKDAAKNPRPPRKWETETAKCPRCGKNTGRIYTDDDGDHYRECTRLSCEVGSTTVIKSLARMAVEYPDSMWGIYKFLIPRMLKVFPSSKYWLAYEAAKKAEVTKAAKEAA